MKRGTTKGGYFGTPRDWLAGPTLQTADPFSPTEAVVWLLKNAAYKETTTVVGKG